MSRRRSTDGPAEMGMHFGIVALLFFCGFASWWWQLYEFLVEVKMQYFVGAPL